MVTPKDILEVWLTDVGPDRWYAQDAELDAEIRAKFETPWWALMGGAYHDWLVTAEGALAYVILGDQFPRNMFRGTAQAFASDKIALAAAKNAIHQGLDMKIAEPERQFFYLPMMHSENLCDQERCVRMMLEHMPEKGAGNLLHAKAHREVIRRFGRFPYRNAALGRVDTEQERAFIAAGGYMATVRTIQEARSAA